LKLEKLKKSDEILKHNNGIIDTSVLNEYKDIVKYWVLGLYLLDTLLDTRICESDK